MRRNHMTQTFTAVLLTLFTGMLAAACSSTSGVPEGDQLFTGLKPIKYENYTKGNHFLSTQEEVEAALATAPNGALLGSSYYRTPIQMRLWIWNAFHNDTTGIGKWMTKSFGKAPVLMSWVNPELRASVATNLIRNHGYFHGSVNYEKEDGKNPKKAKIAYTVNMGPLFTVDTISYRDFPAEADSLLAAHLTEAKVKKGTPFDVSLLDEVRNRISTLFRNNGCFYYQPDCAVYLADTLTRRGQAQLQLQLAGGIDPKAKRKWYIGNVSIDFRRQYTDVLRDSLSFRHFTARYNGRKPPVRLRVVWKNMRLYPKRLYSYENYQQTVNNISNTGLFSMTNFSFTPRDTTSACDTLDLRLNCIFDKPYDFYIETNATGKTTGRVGPELVLGFTKRNAFRGNENLDINLHGSYEWQTNAQNGKEKLNSYEFGGDISLELPRILSPFPIRRLFYASPSTLIKASTNTLNRASFFKRRIVSGELTYKFQPTATMMHEFSPLTLEYEYMKKVTEKFAAILDANPYLLMSMQDQFLPKMKYTFTYTSPKENANPIYWQTTLSESANVLSLGYMAFGKKWNQHDKQMFKNPYAQFVKLETDFRKTWALTPHSQLVGHVSGGLIWAFGNSERAPYSEQFYVGGANSIRAFTVRSIGPGAYYTDQSRLSYMDQTGDIKLQANLEYRTRLFGNLYGAAFLDAGNIWAMHDDGYRANSKFKLKNLADQMALGTGIGIRYDLEFFVLRVDWGVGIHLPYDTGKRGYYNIPHFKDGQSLHLAIGYPF